MRWLAFALLAGCSPAASANNAGAPPKTVIVSAPPADPVSKPTTWLADAERFRPFFDFPGPTCWKREWLTFERGGTSRGFEVDFPKATPESLEKHFRAAAR